eukprot:6754803-Prymnesium_polylepis.1
MAHGWACRRRAQRRDNKVVQSSDHRVLELEPSPHVSSVGWAESGGVLGPDVRPPCGRIVAATRSRNCSGATNGDKNLTGSTEANAADRLHCGHRCAYRQQAERTVEACPD